MDVRLPLVSIGLPTRNGAQTLSYALEALLRQTHSNIEIVVSDNASSDETSEIVSSYQVLDSRVRMIHQTSPLSMWENYRAVFYDSSGQYFMWASDDDIVSEGYVETLLRELVVNPDADLSFGTVRSFRSHDEHQVAKAIPYTCDTRGIPVWRRLWMHKQSGFAVMGLFRRSALSGYRWWDHTVSPDWPFLTYIMVRSEIAQTSEGAILYRYSGTGGPAWERAREQSFREIESFPTARLSWRCALASRAAARSRGSTRLPLLDFVLLFGGLLWSNRRFLVQWQLDGWRRRLGGSGRASRTNHGT